MKGLIMEMDFINLLQTFGFIAAFGSFLVLIADLYLCGGPLRDGEPDIFYRIARKRPRSVMIGHTLGVLAIPLCLLGFVPIWFALSPLGLVAATAITFSLAYIFMVGPGVHSLFAPIGFALARTGNADVEADAATNEPAQQEAERMEALLKRWLFAFGGPAVLVYLIASLSFSWVVITGRTDFPWWLGLWSPGPVTLAFMQAPRWTTPRIAGFLSPACVHIAYLPFILTVTFLIG